MKKFVFGLASMLLITSGCTQQENVDEPVEKDVYEIIHVKLGAKLSDLREAAEGLDSLESAEIKFDVKMSGEIGFRPSSSDSPRRNIVYPGFSTGKITKKGRIKTLWEYGVGQNLVPAGLCGAYSISDWYEISGKGGIGIPGATYVNTTGKFSGWSGHDIRNPQTPYQFNRGTDSDPEFVTFIYDILSGADGTTPPGGHLWVPCPQDSVLLYYDIVLPTK